MNEQTYLRLLPFLKKKAARQRLVLYLIAEGLTVAALARMTVPELQALELGFDMEVTRDEVLEGRQSGLAFVYPSGRAIGAPYFYRLLRTAATVTLGHPMSQEQFRRYLCES
jgi:hypothetical protein